MFSHSIAVAALLVLPHLSLTVSAAALSPFKSLLERADVTLADGTSMQYSTAPLANGLSWQASGFLESGGCTSGKQFITDCYELTLSDDPSENLQPPAASPRQRTEFLTAHRPDGSKWHYTWRSYVPSYVTGASSFFHLMQIFSTADGDPVLFLDIIKTNVEIKDVETGTIVTAPLTSFENTPLLHTMTVTYGPSGSVSYAITNSQTGASIIKYSKTGYVGSGGTYLKFGAYRSVYDGMSDVKIWYGDFVQTEQ